jgi:tetratricopeptide (TPR) repeat protein
MPTATQLPEQLGRYRILQKLGEGGMGAVYLAEDSQLGRQVALKVPHFTSQDSRDVIERFRREARVAASIEHPNICSVHDVGETDGIHFLTMPFIEGTPLSKRLHPGQPWPPAQATALVIRLARALHAMHQRGLMHRDLKPANIILRLSGEPMIMDFGLARSLTHSDRLTGTGVMVGTPAYVSPEQVMGDPKAVGAATDIYSLGVICYELLTGQPPFLGPGHAIFGQILHAEATPPSACRAGLNQQLDAICKKALAKQPANRYATMGEFATELETYLHSYPAVAVGDLAPETAPPSPCPVPAALRPTPPPASRHTDGNGRPAQRRQNGRALCAGGLVGTSALILLIGLWFSGYGGKEKEMEREKPPQAAKKEPSRDLVAGLVRVGNAWSSQEEYDKAIRDYTEAIHLDPKYALAFCNRGLAWSNKKEYDKAIQDYTEAIRLDPNDAAAFNHRGNAWSNKKEYDKAIQDFNEAIRLDPKSQERQRFQRSCVVTGDLSRGQVSGGPKSGGRCSQGLRIDRMEGAQLLGHAGCSLCGIWRLHPSHQVREAGAEVSSLPEGIWRGRTQAAQAVRRRSGIQDGIDRLSR